MKASYIASSMLLFLVVASHAQIIHEKETFRGLTSDQVASASLPPPQHLRDYVADGKLRLNLRDAVILALENNSNVRIDELQVENAKYSVLRAHGPFDPLALASFNALRSTSPSSSQLAGAPTLSTLGQVTNLGYVQTFETGTTVQANFSVNRQSTNSGFSFFNPYFQTNLSFQFTQPLLRGRWLFANRAPLVIARRSLRQSRASFEGLVSDAILLAVNRYWNVVQAKGNLEVQRKSLEAAEATYKRDKRSLELGALPPLDIYRSEAEVASRRVQVIQAEYALKQSEDELRLGIGADLDPYFQALDLSLTETPEPEGELRNTDIASALQEALVRRPEFEGARQALANDNTGIRLAHDNLLPDLKLSGSYSSNGLGGNQFDTTKQLISSGGLGDSLSQLFGFGFPTYGATLTLNLPIRNRAAQAELGNALVAHRRDLYSERLLRETITRETKNAVHQLEQAKLSLAASREALDLAQKSLAATQRKYELGSETPFVVLQTQTELAQAESNLLQAEVGYQLALAAVDHATGTLLEPYRVRITDLTR